MLSNRESARRSRRRKQEHLNTLEEEVRRDPYLLSVLVICVLQDEKEWSVCHSP
jgi:hypothetical protein